MDSEQSSLPLRKQSTFSTVHLNTEVYWNVNVLCDNWECRNNTMLRTKKINWYFQALQFCSRLITYCRGEVCYSTIPSPPHELQAKTWSLEGFLKRALIISLVKCSPYASASTIDWEKTNCSYNLVPRGRDPFGQRQGSRPLARSNTGSPRFTDFPSLCACPESNYDKSDWFWSQSIVFTQPFTTGKSLNLARAPDFQRMTKGTPGDEVVVRIPRRYKYFSLWTTGWWIPSVLRAFIACCWTNFTIACEQSHL